MTREQGATSALAEFLLARIAEDRNAAETANWAMQGHWYQTEEGADGALVARWSPKRVLSECEAKSRLVAWDSGWQANIRDHALRLLALTYSDHPGYQQEWAV